MLQRKFRVESQVENLIQKYDSDISEKQVSLNNILFFMMK